MSTPRKRRWFDVLRRSGAEGRGAPFALDDAALWTAQDQAARSLTESGARAEKVATSVARHRSLVEAAAERANLVAARAEGLGPMASRVAESFERLGVVALNAGLEGARAEGPHGRALLLLSDEIRAGVARGAEAAEQLARSAAEIAAEAADVRRQLERSRTEVSEVGQDAAHLQAAAQQATKALDELGSRLRRATGMDPEMARLVAQASEHARGLMTALSALTTTAPGAAALSALRPIIAPLARVLGEIDDPEGGEGDEPSHGGSGGSEGSP